MLKMTKCYYAIPMQSSGFSVKNYSALKFLSKSNSDEPNFSISLLMQMTPSTTVKLHNKDLSKLIKCTDLDL